MLILVTVGLTKSDGTANNIEVSCYGEVILFAFYSKTGYLCIVTTRTKTMHNSANRIIDEIYFVTTTVVDWVDIFTRPKYKHIIVDSLAYCLR